MSEVVGTLYTMAPEVLNGGVTYDKSCDMWSIGVIAFILLSGDMPFDTASKQRLIKAVEDGRFEFSGRRWNRVSSEARRVTVVGRGDFVAMVVWLSYFLYFVLPRAANLNPVPSPPALCTELSGSLHNVPPRVSTQRSKHHVRWETSEVGKEHQYSAKAGSCPLRLTAQTAENRLYLTPQPIPYNASLAFFLLIVRGRAFHTRCIAFSTRRITFSGASSGT